MSLLLGSVLLLSLFGCEKNEEIPEEPIDGGNTHHVDPDAPKQIGSSDIASLDVCAFIANRYYGDEEHDFHFTVSEENGRKIFAEEYSGAREEADETLLRQVQEVIERNDLVSFNGVYDVTAGIAPEYQARSFLVTYGSGEKISFTMDNDPYALWAEELYDVFAGWLHEKGNDTLYPEEDDSLLTRFRLSYTDGKGMETEYSDIYIRDKNDEKKLVLMRSVYDKKKDKEMQENYIEFPETYFEDLSRIIAGSDVRRNYRFSLYDHKEDNYGNHEAGYYGMGDKSTFDEEEDSEMMDLDIYLDYESGSRFNIETKKESEIKAFLPLIEELLRYHEKLFE